MDITKIDSGFTDDTEPEDEHLIALLKRAYKGEILCTLAIADFATIKPFSDYMPSISDKYRSYFTKKAQGGTPPILNVYAENSELIMSDDYKAFAMYKELGFQQAMCVVIGETPAIEGVEYQGDPFRLPPPSIEVLPES